MLRSVSKQSGDSMQSVLKKNREATVGRICRKGMKAMEWWTTNNKWCIAGSTPCMMVPDVIKDTKQPTVHQTS